MFLDATILKRNGEYRKRFYYSVTCELKIESLPFWSINIIYFKIIELYLCWHAKLNGFIICWCQILDIGEKSYLHVLTTINLFERVKMWIAKEKICKLLWQLAAHILMLKLQNERIWELKGSRVRPKFNLFILICYIFSWIYLLTNIIATNMPDHIYLVKSRIEFVFSSISILSWGSNGVGTWGAFFN